MTSNVGSQIILERGTADWAEVETAVLGALRQHFRPEFLNRVDDIVVFRPLSMAQLEEIVELQLTRLRQLLAEKKITLELTPEAKHALTTEGYDPDVRCAAAQARDSADDSESAVARVARRRVPRGRSHRSPPRVPTARSCSRRRRRRRKNPSVAAR